MTNQTQLLCTFTTIEGLETTLRQIVSNYSIAFDMIYVLENIDAPTSLCCTYNINSMEHVGQNVPPATISLHRKKISNTLYTINALNILVKDLNNGKLDSKFAIPWEQYKNAILVTAYDKLKRINTRLDRIVKVSDLPK